MASDPRGGYFATFPDIGGNATLDDPNGHGSTPEEAVKDLLLKQHGPVGVEPLPYGGYSAVYSDSYDGAPDSNHPMGFGRTQNEATWDLYDNTDHGE